MQLFCLDSNREFFYLWTQRQWLEEQLKKSEAKWKIVVLHHPLYSVKGAMNNLIQRWMFDDLIQEHGVNLVLQGHEHAYARRGDNGQQSTIYLISHCSPKGYRINPPEGRFEKIEKGEACLSVRYWTGKPYRSKQVEIARLTREDGIGLQQLSFSFGDITKPRIKNDNDPTPQTLAKNDGLSFTDWFNWFRGYNLTNPLAIIHFTPFRY